MHTHQQHVLRRAQSQQLGSQQRPALQVKRRGGLGSRHLLRLLLTLLCGFDLAEVFDWQGEFVALVNDLQRLPATADESRPQHFVPPHHLSHRPPQRLDV